MEHTFAERLRLLRRQKGWSRYELARRLGVASDTVKSWEEERTQPRIGMAGRIAKIFSCKIGDLLANGDEI